MKQTKWFILYLTGRQLNQSSLYIFYGKTCSADGGVVSFPISDTFYL